MEQPHDLELARRRQRRSRLLRRLGVLLLLFFLLLGALALYVTQRGSIQEEIDLFFSNFDSGPGFPIDSPGGTALAIYPMGANLAVVNDTNLYLYNQTGALLQSAQLSYHDPVVKTTGSYLLLYDGNDRTLSVFGKTRQLLEKQYDEPIYAADLISDRTLAVATRSQHYTSEVTVYNDLDGEARFRWYSAENMVGDLALSPDGQLLAVSGISAQGGVLHSTLYLFSIYGQSELTRLELEEELICSVAYKQDGTLHVITDRQVLAFSPDGLLTARYDLGGRELAQFWARDKHSTVLLLGNYSRDRRTTLVYLDEALQSPAERTIDYEVLQLRSGREQVWLMGFEVVDCYDRFGTLLLSQAAQTPKALAVTRRGAYLADDGLLLELERPNLPTSGD